MNVMIDWNYYNSHFPKLNEQRFDELIYQASSLVARRVNDIVPTENEEFLLKDCICSVLNVLDSAQSIGLKSISNDGYSKTFENTSQNEFNAQIDSIISSYLGGTRLYKSQFLTF